MAWELRSGRRYYYRSKRTAGGRITKTYLGAGLAAGLISAADQRRRSKRRRAVVRDRALLSYVRGFTEELAELCNLIDARVCVALRAAEYHQHRGEWRRRHGRQRNVRTQIDR